MKHVRQAVKKPLRLLPAFLLLLGVFGYLFINNQKAHAATGDWQSALGTVNVGDMKAGRFVAIDYKTFRDTATGVLYVSDVTANDVYNGGDGVVMKGNKGWFFWPKVDGGTKVLAKKTNGNCYGFIYVGTLPGGFGNPNGKAVFGLGTPQKKVNDECRVYNDAGNRLNNVTGVQDRQVLQNTYGTGNWNLVSNAKQFGTPLYWVDSETIGIQGTSRKLHQATGDYRKILLELTKKQGDVRNPDSLRYFRTADEYCGGSNEQPEAWVAVNWGTGGGSDRDTAYVLHRRGGHVNLQWDGSQLKCMFGRNITMGPNETTGGSSHSGQIGIMYPSTAKSDQELEAQNAAAKAVEVEKVLNTDINKVVFCWASAYGRSPRFAPDRNADFAKKEDMAGVYANYLAKVSTPSTEKDRLVVSCIEKAYGEPLAKALDKTYVERDAGSDDLNSGDDPAAADEAQCIVNPPLGWILCPIITVGIKTVEWLEGQVTAALEFPPLSSEGNFSVLYETWSSFKNLANAALVLIFLVMIFAQVLPIEVDPYMAKKLLPRLIAAAIFIQFSYLFVQILVDITNVLAGGVSSIIGSVSTGSNGGGFWGGGSATGASAFGSMLAIAGGTAGIAAAASAGAALIVPVLLLLLSAAISILTLFVTLEVRIVLIIVYTMVAPLAILAWVLPNTESYFKKWFSTLFKLLLMYPIIVFMVEGTGLIVNVAQDATAAIPNGGAASLIFNLLVSIIPIIIFFMIPATFKWAGGMFAAVSGAIQTQGNRWAKQARSGSIMKNSLQDIKDKSGIKLLDTKDEKGFGRLGARVLSGNAFSFGATGRKKIRKAQEEAQAKRNELFQDEYRDVANAPLMRQMVDEVLDADGNGTGVFRMKEGLSTADTLSKMDLILSRGGTLEASDYFAALQGDGPVEKLYDDNGKFIGTKQGKVTRNAKGGVEAVDDEIWGQLQKKHGTALAAALPHTTGKAMQSQDGGGLNKAKGAQPAREILREFEQLGDTFTKPEDILNAKQQMMQQFYDAAQRDDAGSMDIKMVKTLERMLKDSDAAATEFQLSNGKTMTAAEFFDQQISSSGRMTRFVQP